MTKGLSLTSAGPTDHGPRDAADPLGEVMLRSPLDPREAVDSCDALARAGKLPGFQRSSPTSCVSRLFGQPFDRTLHIDAVDAPQGSVVRLSTRLRRKTPVIFAIVGVSTVWPGVWLTDSLIQTYFSGASNWIVKTWMWYLPLAVVPLPFAARSMWRKSQHDAAEHFAEIRERVAKAVGASMDASAHDHAAPSRTPEAVSASA